MTDNTFPVDIVGNSDRTQIGFHDDSGEHHSIVTAETNAVTGGITAIAKLTQAQYDALAVKDKSTLYLIVDGADSAYVNAAGSSRALLLQSKAWYDPSDLTTLFQDIAGATPVTAVGQPVGLMLDKSGNGNHVSQSTDALRPTLGLVRGKLAIVGTGTQWLYCAGTTAFSTFTLIGAVSKAQNTGIQGWFSDAESEAGGVRAYTVNETGSSSVYNGSSYISPSTFNIQQDANYIHTVSYSGTVETSQINSDTKNALVTAYTPDASAGFRILGSASIGYLNGAFFGGAYFNRYLIAPEENSLKQFFRDKAEVKTIKAVGDSHTYNNSYGQTVVNFYPERVRVALAAVSSFYQAGNYGVSGNSTASMVARSFTYSGALTQDVAIVYGGTNDAAGATTVQASPSPTSTTFSVASGVGARYGAGGVITVGSESAAVLSVSTDAITLTAPLAAGAPSAGTSVTIDTTANLIKIAQAIGAAKIIVLGQHYLNFASGGDAVGVPLAGNVTLRAKQSAAATALGAVYVDLHAIMEALIVDGTYTQGNDAAWHVATGNTHLNNTGEQIIADAVYAVMQTRGWL